MPSRQGHITTSCRRRQRLAGPDAHDGTVSVALYNHHSAATSIAVDFTTLGWEAGTAATVRDLWAHKDMGTFKGSYGPVSVPSHATTMLRLARTA